MQTDRKDEINPTVAEALRELLRLKDAGQLDEYGYFPDSDKAWAAASTALAAQPQGPWLLIFEEHMREFMLFNNEPEARATAPIDNALGDIPRPRSDSDD